MVAVSDMIISSIKNDDESATLHMADAIFRYSQLSKESLSQILKTNFFGLYTFLERPSIDSAYSLLIKELTYISCSSYDRNPNGSSKVFRDITLFFMLVAKSNI